MKPPLAHKIVKKLPPKRVLSRQERGYVRGCKAALGVLAEFIESEPVQCGHIDYDCPASLFYLFKQEVDALALLPQEEWPCPFLGTAMNKAKEKLPHNS